jgi:hypothetical protein
MSNNNGDIKNLRIRVAPNDLSMILSNSTKAFTMEVSSNQTCKLLIEKVKEKIGIPQNVRVDYDLEFFSTLPRKEIIDLCGPERIGDVQGDVFKNVINVSIVKSDSSSVDEYIPPARKSAEAARIGIQSDTKVYEKQLREEKKKKKIKRQKAARKAKENAQMPKKPKVDKNAFASVGRALNQTEDVERHDDLSDDEENENEVDAGFRLLCDKFPSEMITELNPIKNIFKTIFDGDDGDDVDDRKASEIVDAMDTGAAKTKAKSTKDGGFLTTMAKKGQRVQINKSAEYGFMDAVVNPKGKLQKIFRELKRAALNELVERNEVEAQIAAIETGGYEIRHMKCKEVWKIYGKALNDEEDDDDDSGFLIVKYNVSVVDGKTKNKTKEFHFILIMRTILEHIINACMSSGERGKYSLRPRHLAYQMPYYFWSIVAYTESRNYVGMLKEICPHFDFSGIEECWKKRAV